MYEKIINADMQGDVRIVDLRSDTISKPTQQMREAMYNAVVGDDVYGEDPTVVELERRSAEVLGKEDAAFVVSGTMANLLAIMVHCNQRGSEMISGDNGHTFRFEQGGSAQIAGVQTALVKNNEDGTFNLDELRQRIRKNPDFHEPVTSLIVVENTHNLCGGKVLPLDWLEKVGNIAQENNIAVHMDGARIMNAAVYLQVPPKRVAKDVDSVCFCLSKGLGAPIGAMLCGSKSFISKAKRFRKALGGGWRQAGILAAAGLVALDTMIDRLYRDHEHTYRIAKAISDLNSPVFKIDLKSVQTNILILKLNSSKFVAKDFVKRITDVQEDDPIKVSVRASSRDKQHVRFVTYWEITDDDADLAIAKILFVIKDFENKYSE
ncbi:probable low-specificity L-threonine aldolase 2 isoform X1 [Anoplophora glabripennis]|uniref:probable low-specificity L-threonine aldolase 2 isoform X1 n=2 Tax=Anoplophora glabripennis TaxID=217634 RepID=UPI000873F8A6|nr:probable low-specificity L-threonine aldolase 2 isoform X1 [Anoplophora glabripennis]XP_023311437.1 probable low-specificity L-threonine aldolase 2 isoform X1 [Anoplophora glabripennis]